MHELVETAYAAARLAFRTRNPTNDPRELDEWVVEAGPIRTNAHIVEVLLNHCFELTIEKTGLFAKLSTDEQLMVYEALGILKTAEMMPDFWADWFVMAAECSLDELEKREWEAAFSKSTLALVPS